MEPPPISPTLTVEQLFANWPQTMPVFLRHRFGCIGCLMAPFDTLHDVARNYNVPVGSLISELDDAIHKRRPQKYLSEIDKPINNLNW